MLKYNFCLSYRSLELLLKASEEEREKERERESEGN